MNKVFLQGLLLIFLFFGGYFLLAQIDWINFFSVNKIKNSSEKKLGDILWSSIKNSEKECYDTEVIKGIDSIVTKICLANGIDKDDIKLHIIKKDVVNAFAMPDGYLVVYTGLIKEADNAEEVAGVIAHEVAHIKLNHVMKKLVKELGLSMIISATTGGSDPQAIKSVIKLLTSSAFDRNMEKEADITGVEYLLKAQINPEALAEFMFKIARTDKVSSYFKWISTHPEGSDRSKYILEYSKLKKPVEFKKVISDKTWVLIQERLNEE